MTPSPTPTYLVELMDHTTGDLSEVDLYARIDTAMDKAVIHCKGFVTRVEVSTDADDVIDGIGFFDPENNLRACVTVYAMERDTEEPSTEAVRQACMRPPFEMEALLNGLLAANTSVQ